MSKKKDKTKRAEDTARQAAVKKIDDLVAEAQAHISAAEKLADEFGIGFSWEGSAYGMGGWYRPRTGELSEEELSQANAALAELNTTGVMSTNYSQRVARVAMNAYANGNMSVENYISDNSTDYGDDGGWQASAGSC